MTNEQILKKAIEGVMKNGYKLVDENENWKIDVNQPDKENKDPIPWIVRSWKNEDEIIHPFDIIFSHDFAKAFWGEEKVPTSDNLIMEKNGTIKGNISYRPAWKAHIQRMVLEKEPLKYIEKFL